MCLAEDSKDISYLSNPTYWTYSTRNSTISYVLLNELVACKEWQFLTDVSGQIIGPIFKGQESDLFGFLTL